MSAQQDQIIAGFDPAYASALKRIGDNFILRSIKTPAVSHFSLMGLSPGGRMAYHHQRRHFDEARMTQVMRAALAALDAADPARVNFISFGQPGFLQNRMILVPPHEARALEHEAPRLDPLCWRVMIAYGCEFMNPKTYAEIETITRAWRALDHDMVAFDYDRPPQPYFTVTANLLAGDGQKITVKKPKVCGYHDLMPLLQHLQIRGSEFIEITNVNEIPLRVEWRDGQYWFEDDEWFEGGDIHAIADIIEDHVTLAGWDDNRAYPERILRQIKGWPDYPR